MLTKFCVFSATVFVLCWAAWLAAQAKDIYEKGFIECYETTTFNQDNGTMLCVKREE